MNRLINKILDKIGDWVIDFGFVCDSCVFAIQDWISDWIHNRNNDQEIHMIFTNLGYGLYSEAKEKVNWQKEGF